MKPTWKKNTTASLIAGFLSIVFFAQSTFNSGESIGGKLLILTGDFFLAGLLVFLACLFADWVVRGEKNG